MIDPDAQVQVDRDNDQIVIYNDDNTVALAFIRHSGRDKVYIQSPLIDTASLTKETVCDIANWLIETVTK